MQAGWNPTGSAPMVRCHAIARRGPSCPGTERHRRTGLRARSSCEPMPIQVRTVLTSITLPKRAVQLGDGRTVGGTRLPPQDQGAELFQLPHNGVDASQVAKCNAPRTCRRADRGTGGGSGTLSEGT
jgi:hypothetical protein